MSAFKGSLDARCIGDRKWRLLSSLMYESDLAGQTIVVPAGTETDFLSTYGVPFAAEEFDGDDNEPAVLHDFLYSCHMFDRAMSDAILREACIATGTARWKAWIIWAGVRIGGASHW